MNLTFFSPTRALPALPLKLVLPALVLLAALVLAPGLALAFPQPPNIFFGAATIDGAPAPDGLEVMVKLSEGGAFRTVASSPVAQGRYGMEQRLSVPGDDPETPEKEGAALGETLHFFLATPQGELPHRGAPIVFEVAGARQMDLAFSAGTVVLSPTPTPEPSPTSGGGARPATPAVSGALATVGVIISNFTATPQTQDLELTRGPEVVDRQRVEAPGHSEVSAEFEVPRDDVSSYSVRANGNGNSRVSLNPDSSSLVFDNLQVIPAEIKRGQTALVTVNVSNQGAVATQRRVSLRVDGQTVGLGKDVLVQPRAVEVVTFEYTPGADERLGQRSLQVAEATGFATITEPLPWLLIGGAIAGAALLLAALAFWLLRSARRGEASH